MGPVIATDRREGHRQTNDTSFRCLPSDSVHNASASYGVWSRAAADPAGNEAAADLASGKY